MRARSENGGKSISHTKPFIAKPIIAKPLIAVSRCLLGERVRYDANIKQYPQLLHFIQQHFTIIGVCPEVEIGLSVPRPAVQLSGTLNNIKMRGRDDASIDVTDKMQNYCQQRTPQLNSIYGYIFKSKSPSCGIKDIPLFDDEKIIDITSGLFANAILQHYPKLPITDEQGLQTTAKCDDFLQQVKQYQQKNNGD